MLRLTLSALVLLTSTACGELEIPITRTKTFRVETASEACAQVVHEESLDTEESRPYLDKLTAVEVREVRLAITNANTTGDSVATTVSGSLAVAAPGNDNFTTLVPATEAAVVVGEISPLPMLDPNGVNLVSGVAMTPPHAIRVKAEGCFDQVPAGVEFEATITYVLRGSLF